MTAALVQKVVDFWREQISRWIGDWLVEATTVKQICEFTDTVFAR
jgi:hypothetical protein